MAGSFTSYMEDVVMNYIFGKGSYTPGSIYIGLSLANPGEGATGAACQEVPNTFGYARAITNPGDWTIASSGLINNQNTISFPAAVGGDWGLVTHFVLLNSPIYGSGSVLMYSDLVIPIIITNGSLPKFEPSRLFVSLG